LDKPKAKCSYKMLKDLWKRETGQFRNPTQFRHNRIGSTSLVARHELAFKLHGHEGCVNSLHFNTSGTRLASGSDDLDVIVWDWEKKKKALSYSSGHNANIFQSKFLPFTGDTHIVSTSRDGQVRLAELSATGVCHSTKKLAQHRGPVNKAALLSDSPHCFLTGGEDGVVLLVDVRESKATKLLAQKDSDKPKKIPIYSVDTHPLDGGRVFCTAGRDQYIRLYDRRYISEQADKSMKKFCPHHLIDSESKSNVTCAVFNYDGSEVIGSYNDDDVYLFMSDHSDGADYRKRYMGHRNHMTGELHVKYFPLPLTMSDFVLSKRSQLLRSAQRVRGVRVRLRPRLYLGQAVGEHRQHDGRRRQGGRECRVFFCRFSFFEIHTFLVDQRPRAPPEPPRAGNLRPRRRGQDMDADGDFGARLERRRKGRAISDIEF
jgi:hypothetical protein